MGKNHGPAYNNTPDNAGIIESGSIGANQSLRLLIRANSLNVTNNKVIGGNLHNRQPNHSKRLGVEHAARRNLHVVANLHVRNIRQAVGTGHVSPGLEQHHSNRASGEPR